MSFTPPTFSDHGKSAKDVLNSKKYNFNSYASLKSQAANNVKVESEVQTTGESFVKFTHDNAQYGKWEGKYNTNGTTTYSFETQKLADGLKVKLSGDEQPAGTADITYKQEGLAFTASLKSNSAKASASVTSAVVVGLDGLSVGGEVVLDAKAQAVTDYNAVAQYVQKDFTVGLKTKNSAEDIAVSYVQDIDGDFTVAGEATYNIASGARSLTTGYAYSGLNTVDLKGKLTNSGKVTQFVEHKLPQLVLRLTGEFQSPCFGGCSKASSSEKKFGIAFLFGEQ